MTNQDTTEPEQWAVEQHIKKNPKCEWLCTHTKLENLGEQPQIDEPNLDEQIERILLNVALNGAYEDAGQRVLSRHIIGLGISDLSKLIATQIQEAEKQGVLNALTQLKVDYMNEWVGIDPKTMGLKTAPLTYQALIEDRIAQLRSTK